MKTALEKRLIQSKKLASQAEEALEMLYKMPSFAGRAKFVDKLTRVTNNANRLVVDLMVDVSEEREF